MEIIDLLVLLAKPLVWVWNKLSRLFKETKLYSNYKRLKFAHKLYKKTKTLYFLKKDNTKSIQRTDKFECLFRKFCVDIKDFMRQVFASTQCSEQRTSLSEITRKIKAENTGDFIKFIDFYKFYREYVNKSSDCITYKNNTTYNEHKKQLLNASEEFYDSIAMLLNSLYCLLNQEEKRRIEEAISIKH